MMAVVTLMGCNEQDEPAIVSYTPVDVSLAFSIPDMYEGAVNTTRMADSVVQVSADYYRGLKDVHIIPFETTKTITKDDDPFIFDATGRSEEGRVSGKPSELIPEAAFYYYPECSFWPGTASMLFYAKGANTVKVNGVDIAGTDKSYYGSTLTTGTDNRTPSQIQFSPEQIYAGSLADPSAQALADYLTAIANTKGWDTTGDTKLEALFLNFLHQDKAGNFGVIAGSSANIRAFVEELYLEVGKCDPNDADALALASAIRANIKKGATVDDEGHVTLTKWNETAITDYPHTIGLPDGTAAIQWNGISFQPQTETTVEAAITSLDRFVYPAELCYYGNSTIKTSVYKISETVYKKASTWEEILGQYKTGNVVNASIKSAAMVSPVQYGVARLSVRLLPVDLESAPLLDANGDKVSFADTYYPLTAVIVGGQYPVGFDFRPETVKAWPSDEAGARKMTDQMFFVYDAQVKTRKSDTGAYDYFCLSSAAESGNTNTLVLQSYDKKNVKIILEFENRSGKKFMGHDGIVYPGTKFYLIGEVNPVTAETVLTDENKDRVFTQDYITTFMVRVNSFENAYNVMPDLLAPRMEIGVEVPNWQTIRPTTVELQK